MNKSQIIRIGTRGSALALWQANFVQSCFSKLGVQSEIIIIKTKGDKIQNLSFDKIEGKGFFTKEIEEQLLENQIDVAIHSCKDLETQNPSGLCIGAIFNRHNANDSILFKPEVLDEIDRGEKENICFGTSSARRKSQLLRLYPGAKFKDIRGNVPTRIEKLKQDEDLDAIVLANAGYSRLEIDLGELKEVILPVDKFIPAAAQGALALQCRDGDKYTLTILDQINESNTAACVNLERFVLAKLGGGCQKPSAVHVYEENNTYRVLISHADRSDMSGVVISETFNELPGTDAIEVMLAELDKKKTFSTQGS